MTTGKPTVLYVGDPIEGAHAEWAAFQEKFNVIKHSFRTPEEFVTALSPGGKYASIQAIVRPSNPAAELDVGPFDKKLIAELPPSLKMISSVNHGYEKEDVDELGRKGIWYCNGAGAANDSTADIAIFLIIAAFRYTTFFERALRDMSSTGLFDDPDKPPVAASHSPFFLVGQEDSELTKLGQQAFTASQNPFGHALGLIGLGEVGLATAKRAVVLGMNIHYHTRSRKSVAVEDMLNGAVWHADLSDMLKLVDCVCVACPLNSSTYHIMDKKAFSVMKRGSRLINVGRGKCVDEEALVEALDSGVIAGVGLDVFHDEPKIHPRLRESWRVTMLPHIGGDTQDANKNFEAIALRNVEEFFYGSGQPLTAVNHVGK